MDFTNHEPASRQCFLPVEDYDLGATLTSGQAFRWRSMGNTWWGVIGHRWISLKSTAGGLLAETAEPVGEWDWLENYLQVRCDFKEVLAALPKDETLAQALQACHGLRLLRQNPWECLASFILSSTKQIVQIQQVIELLCQRYGNPVLAPPGWPPAWAFPSPARLAQCTETELRACKMGFRAAYVREAARRVDQGELDLPALSRLPLDEARARLMELRGVGRKIADCVLLFALGFQAAFPVDVWIQRALKQCYFPRRHKLTQRQTSEFVAAYFGPCAGYAQQYLFHYFRVKLRPPPRS